MSEWIKCIKEGVTQLMILWKFEDLGNFAVMAGAAAAKLEYAPGATEFNAGKLGKMLISGDNIVLGNPFVFTADNIDQFEFSQMRGASWDQLL